MTKKNQDTDVAFIKALTELLSENDLTELEVKREYGDSDSLKVRVSRVKQVVAAVAAPVANPVAATLVAAAPAAVAAPEVNDDPAAHPGAVPSPMVGTAYLSPEPGIPPFVSVGSQITEGDTLMIVEAMKTMNHIPAPASGTVKRILVADGDAIEFGQPLMIIE